jgi:hypothetical protein
MESTHRTQNPAPLAGMKGENGLSLLQIFQSKYNELPIISGWQAGVLAEAVRRSLYHFDHQIILNNQIYFR